MTQVLRVLLEVTVYSAVLFAAIMLFKTAARGKVSPVLGFALWFLLVARLCVPVTLDAGVTLFHLPQAALEEQVVAGDTAGETPETQNAPQTEALPQNAGVGQNTPPGAGTPADAQNGLRPGPGGETPPVETTAKPSTPKWPDVLVGIWLAGAAALLCWTGFIGAKLAQVVKKRSVPARGRLCRIYADCAALAEVKNPPPLLVTQNLTSPALVASPRPKLLLPLDFVERADEQRLWFALLHELTHFKRKDHWVCLLMRALCAVYWFNPVVWLADRQVVLDMETACDSMVVKRMKKEERNRYANTVLELAVRRREPRLMLGMALFNTKKVAETRIRGIYMKNKTKGAVKVAAVLLVAVMGAACFTTACQPVREEAGAATQPAQPAETQPPAPTQAASPTPTPEPELPKYTGAEKEIADGISVRYDAVVDEPKAELPVVSIEMDGFTIEDVQKVADYFFAGQGIQMYAPWARTKDEIQAEIDYLEDRNAELEAERALYEADPEAMAADEAALERDSSGPDALPYEEWSPQALAYENYRYMEYEHKENLRILEEDREELAAAPQTRVKQPAVMEFQTIETSTGEMTDELELWGEGPDGAIPLLQARANQMGNILYQRDHYTGKAYIPQAGQAPRVTLTREEAQAIAEQAVAAVCPQMGVYNVDMVRGDTWHIGYVFTFRRMLDGVPVGSINRNMGMYGYASSEEISVYVDDRGISSFNWSTPYGGLVPGEAQPVYSVEEAADAFETVMPGAIGEMTYLLPETEVGRYGSYGLGLESITLEVSRIRLVYVMTMADYGTPVLVPAYDFIGEAVGMKDGKPVENNTEFGMSDMSLGVVSALDGSYLPRMGFACLSPGT